MMAIKSDLLERLFPKELTPENYTLEENEIIENLINFIATGKSWN